MGQIKIRRWIVSGVAVAVAVLVVSGAAPASTSTTSCANQAPCNDNYLASLELNTAGSKLNHQTTMADQRDTSTATVQANIFSPCGQAACPAGPIEITNCGATSYGKTVWYDFYPDSDGTISVRTSGFDNVITLYTFDNNPRSVSYLVPDAAHRACVHTSNFPSEQLVAPVKKGGAYTVQIGGVVSSQAPNGAAGPMQVLFDFFATPPRRLSAQATLTAARTSNGIQLLGLSVSTARAATVSVDCGGFCGPESKTKNATENFPGLHGVHMPAGSKLSIRVTAKHSIGVLIEYDITPGAFIKHTFCTEPGSRKPRTTCH